MRNSAPVTILLVRHARAGNRSRWEGDDRDRPLTKKGRAQADGLPAMLEPYTAAGRRRPLMLTSPWLRCVQTLGPLAAICKSVIAEEEILGEGMGPSAAPLLDRWLSSRPTVLCTHGDVISDVLAHLSSLGVSLGPQRHNPKASVWVLDGRPGAISSAVYLPPPG